MERGLLVPRRALRSEQRAHPGGILAFSEPASCEWIRPWCWRKGSRRLDALPRASLKTYERSSCGSLGQPGRSLEGDVILVSSRTPQPQSSTTNCISTAFHCRTSHGNTMIRPSPHPPFSVFTSPKPQVRRRGCTAEGQRLLARRNPSCGGSAKRGPRVPLHEMRLWAARTRTPTDD